MGDTIVGPVLVLGGRGAALIGAEPDVSALLSHLALHSAADIAGAQLYDATYRRLAPVRDGAGTVVALQPSTTRTSPPTRPSGGNASARS